MSLPWPSWAPVPPDWKREFYFVHGDYEFDPVGGRTLFRIEGNTREDNTILVELYGHHPRCYFKSSCDLANARALVAYWEKRARATAHSYFGSGSTWLYEQFADTPRWVLNVTARICEDMIEDRPSERVGARYCVEFAHPCLVKMFREYALYCYGRESDPSIPTWCLDEATKRSFAAMLVYEANVDYVERVIVDRQYPSGVWYRLKNWDRSRRATSRPVDYDDTGKRYDLVVRASIDDIEPTGDETPYPMRVLAYDIEAENQDGDHMPRAAENPILDIVVYAYRDGQKDHAKSFAFELGSCDTVVDKTFFYDNDAVLLQEFRKFVILSRCDVLAAHNGNGFDLPYMIQRAKVLGIRGWDYLGPLRRRVTIRHTVNKGFKKHNAFAPGMLILDTMRIEQETLGARGLGLADCAVRYLDNKLKMDVYPDEISRLQETHGGRSKIHKYCARDAELVMEIEQAQRGLQAGFDMARRSIPIQTVMNRSQGAKGEGAIARIAMKSDPPQIMLVLSFMSRFMRDRPQPRVRGNYRGNKEYEGAINLPSVPIYIVPSGAPRRMVLFVFDFSGLYPSIMCWRNISPDTELRPDTISLMGYREGEHYWSSPDYDEEGGRRRVRNVPDNPKFIKSSVRRGLIPRIQDRLAADRKVVKARMAETTEELEDDELSSDRKRELTSLVAQLSLEERTIKLLMNSIYGLMARLKAGDQEGSSGSGMIHSIRYASMAVASTITREGRGLILLTRDVIHDEFPGAEVVGGDTDSVFVRIETGDDAEAFALGRRMESALNAHYEEPIHIGLEYMAIATDEYRKKNYKRLVQFPRRDGTWSKPTLIVKGESWKKRNFPRNLRQACHKIADILLTADAREDRFEVALAEIRAQARRLATHDVPVGDLIESSKLSMDLKDYNNARGQKGPAMLLRKYDADVAAATRKRDEEAAARSGGHKRKRAVDVHQPEAGDIASFVVAPPSASNRYSSKVTARTVPGLDAITDGLRYDADYYVEQLLKTVSSSFGQALVTLSDREEEVERAVRDKRLEFEERVDRLSEQGGKLSAADAKFLSKVDTPHEREVESLKRQQETRKKKYLDLTKELVGPVRGPEKRENTGIMRFAKRTPRCMKCGLEACACDHAAEREAKRGDLNEAQRARTEAWDTCATCVDDRPEEAERCRSYRSCPNYSLRAHFDFKINRLKRDIVDIEDLMINVG